MDEPRMPAVAAAQGSRTPDISFIGRGISWPMHVDHTGSIALTQGATDLDRSIRVVLSTAPNERVMRPRFGCRIWEMLFEPVTPTLYAEIQAAVFDALAQWEPRVTVQSVDVIQDDADHALVRISVNYVVRATNDKRNLVYPFYVIPREEG
jgi:hypothetical protein